VAERRYLADLVQILQRRGGRFLLGDGHGGSNAGGSLPQVMLQRNN
jgi:hypothetical protein